MTSRFSRSLFLSLLVISASVVSAQTYSYTLGAGSDVALGTGTSSTTFLPPPPSGTAYTRVGAGNGNIFLRNPGDATLGTGYEILANAPTSASVNKISIYDYAAATPLSYVAVTAKFQNGTNGAWRMFIGNGNTFSNANAFTGAETHFTLDWVFGSGTTLTTTYRGTAATALPNGFTFAKNVNYRLEVYCNNSTISSSYSRGGVSYAVAANSTDLWVNNALVIDDGAGFSLADGMNIDSFMFYGENSTSAAAQIILDDMVYSPTFETPTTVNQTVQDGRGYRLLGAPVPGVTVGMLASVNLVQGVTNQYPAAPDNLYLSYDGTAYVPAASTADAVTPGQGFFWLLYDQSITPSATGSGGGTSRSFPVPDAVLTASGTPLDMDVTFSPALNGDGFYMLANPFAQALSAPGVTIAATPGGGTLQNTLQAFDPTTGYVPIDRAAATPVDIATWQGFFAEVAGGTTAPTFTYLAASRTAGTPVLISRPAAITGLRIALDGVAATGETTHDEAAAVRFTEAATSGWDADDASKLTPPTETYALVAPVGTRDGVARRQAVLSRPSGDLADVTLAFTTTTAGTFTLTAESTGLSADATVRDLTTGTVARLADGVTFTSAATDWTERFVVSFGRTTAGEGGTAAVTSLSAPRPNPATGSASLTLRLATPERVTATVVDALGRTVATLFDGEAAAGTDLSLDVDASRLAPGVYVVRVQGATFAETRRLTVAR